MRTMYELRVEKRLDPDKHNYKWVTTTRKNTVEAILPIAKNNTEECWKIIKKTMDETTFTITEELVDHQWWLHKGLDEETLLELKIEVWKRILKDYQKGFDKLKTENGRKKRQKQIDDTLKDIQILNEQLENLK